MTVWFPPLRVLALVIGAACAGCRTAVLTEGENAVWSPDGTRVAFQRHNGSDYDIGIIDVGSGQVRWACAGEGEAAFPAWTPDGGLVYTFCAVTQTTYRAMRTRSRNGFNLRLFSPDGTVRKLTEGRHLDSTSAVAPDGSLWFATTRDCPAIGLSRLWKAASLDAAAVRDARPVNESPGASYRGVQSPAISPDGRLVAWAELRDFWDAWTVNLARVDDPGCPVRLLPTDMIGYSPAWHPDGRHIFLTGHRDGDRGWSVYIVDAKTGALARLAPGRNPSVSPDGTRCLYDDGERIFVRALSPSDFPVATQASGGYADVPEKVLLRLERPKSKTGGKMPAAADLPAGSVWFARAVVDWDGDQSKYQVVFRGGWKTSAFGCRLYFANGIPHFSTREARNKLFSVSSGRVYPDDKPVTITGICTPTAIYVSVNDGVPVARATTMGLLALKDPAEWIAGPQVNDSTSIRSVEFGTGWPDNVPPPMTGKDLYR